MSEAIGRYDVIVIGAGPAGEVLAGRLATAGLTTVIVEQDLVGGECSFYACMPSKALLRPAQALAEVLRVPGAADAVSGALDVGAVLARRDGIVGGLDDAGQVPWLEARDVSLVRGWGRLDGERRVRVGDAVYEAARAVVIATGSVATIPAVPGLAEARPWTNREVTTSPTIPSRLLVMGGGVVGVEMAQAYRSLGADVVVIERGERLLPRIEAFAAEELLVALRDRGIDVHLGASVARVERIDGRVLVRLAGGEPLEGDEILVAVGREPATSELGLEVVGLTAGGFIEVDDHLRVPGMDWLYAIGDVNGRSLLTHMGKRQAHVLSELILGRRSDGLADDAGPPQVIFTEPQIAAVGLTLEAALAAGYSARAYDAPTSGTAGASFHGRGTPGTSRIVVDESHGTLLGATFVGADVGEWLHAATIAISGRVRIERLWDAVPSFPTRSEIWLKLLEAREQALSVPV
jgi:pyruvate/2-oxoglutarate dehydrogenase complex dihydrolipoamide dehydrogenase (E3) component